MSSKLKHYTFKVYNDRGVIRMSVQATNAMQAGYYLRSKCERTGWEYRDAKLISVKKPSLTMKF